LEIIKYIGMLLLIISMEYNYNVRDSNGMVVATSCHLVRFLTNPIIAESLATLRAVEFCRNRRFSHIIYIFIDFT
jgi:hypothetical protein